MGGLVVGQGDLLHGDANGVTSVPLAIAAEVADAAAEFVQAEKFVLDYVRGPGPKTLDGLNAARKEFAAVISKLERRVRPSP